VKKRSKSRGGLTATQEESIRLLKMSTYAVHTRTVRARPHRIYFGKETQCLAPTSDQKQSPRLSLEYLISRKAMPYHLRCQAAPEVSMESFEYSVRCQQLWQDLRLGSSKQIHKIERHRTAMSFSQFCRDARVGIGPICL